VSWNFEQAEHYPGAARTVYDWIDDLSVFPYDRGFLEANHERALKEATLVLSVARPLHERALTVRPDAMYVPNGVDFQHFGVEPPPLPADSKLSGLLKSPKPLAGYYGAFAEWFNYELLNAIAEHRSDWNFLLIGPILDPAARERGRSLKKRKNVFWIGPRSYENLPAYLRLFDVAMIPFVVSEITHATSPLKLYEYLAAGKPVLSTPMPECERTETVTIVKDAEEMAAALDPALRNGKDEAFRARCRAVALEHSWTVRVETITQRFR
jgi:glycosyltransferase involved in cell wall biosynthesis